MMKPPEEWLEDYDAWLLSQTKVIELQDVPKHDIVYGKSMATCTEGSQQRLNTETVWRKLSLLACQAASTSFPEESWTLLCTDSPRQELCLYVTLTISTYAARKKYLLTVQLPANGCRLQMGEIEYRRLGNSVTSEFLCRKKINGENAIITKPNERHIRAILQQLGLESAKPSPVPGKKLDLKPHTLLNEKDKATYVCVGSGIFLAQDRPDIKYSVKELARRIREPRQSDFNNLKTLGRYLAGTKDCGHITQISEDLNIKDAIPTHSFCDSDWAGDVIAFLGGTAIECSSHTQPGVPAIRGRNLGRFRLLRSQRPKFAFCFASIVSQLCLLQSLHFTCSGHMSSC